MRCNWAVIAALVSIAALASCAGAVSTGQFPIIVAIGGAFQSVAVDGAPVQLTATLQNDVPTAGGISWSLTAGGSACSPDCGTLVPGAFPGLTAVYTPPASNPSEADLSPTITAASVTDPSKKKTFSFTILTKATFSMAILLRGFDSDGSPIAMSGVLAGDPYGNVRDGELDVNDGHEIVFVPGPLSGTYSVSSSVDGIVRGTISVSNVPLPTGTINVTFKFITSVDRKVGRIVEVDGSGYFAEGTIQLQDPVARGAALSGPYALELDSDDPLGSRTVEIGHLALSPPGVFASGLVDQSQAGSPIPIFVAQPIAAGSMTGPDALGRGQLTLTVGGNFTKYAYYIVDATQIDLIEIDKGAAFDTVQAGVARAQSAMDAASVNATAVVQMTGMTRVSGGATLAPVSLIGLAKITGGSSFNLLFDANNAGTVSKAVSINGSVTSFDPASGRAVLSIVGGFNGGFVDSAVFYLDGLGAGFIIDADKTSAGGTTNLALSGTLQNQTGAPFSAGSLSGGAILGVGASATRDVPSAVAAVVFDSGAGTFAGTGSLTSFFKSDGAYVDSSFINATYDVVDGANGRGTATVPAALFGDFTKNLLYPASFYIVGPNQAVMIGTESGTDSGIVSFVSD